MPKTVPSGVQAIRAPPYSSTLDLVTSPLASRSACAPVSHSSVPLRASRAATRPLMLTRYRVRVRLS